jgi:glycosyltransferase involved in cell wall biosynthesis
MSNRVSILLPTYNRAGIIADCIDSLFAQSYTDWELVICDDGSSDDTQTIINQFQLKDSRIRYIKNPSRQGLHKSRNRLIAAARGELIFFVEDDTSLEPDSIRILVETYDSFNNDGCRVGAVTPSLVQASKQNQVAFQRKLFDYIKDLRFKNISEPCVIDRLTGLITNNYSPQFERVREVVDIHACSLYPRVVFDREGMFEEKAYVGNYMFAEADYNIRLRKKGYKLLFAPKAIIYHYTYPSGGCRLPFISYAYYAVRNQVLYIARNYGIKAFYMIPSFMIFMAAASTIYLFKRRNVAVGQIETQSRSEGLHSNC